MEIQKKIEGTAILIQQAEKIEKLQNDLLQTSKKKVMWQGIALTFLLIYATFFLLVIKSI